MRLYTQFSLVLCLCLGSSLAATAQQDNPNMQRELGRRKYDMQVARATEPITVDGLLNEAVWQTAVPVDSFYQQFPYDTSYSKYQTQVYAAYDEHYLYFAAICHDGLEGNYLASSLRRDFSGDNDHFGINLNPFNDKTNGFIFGVTPYGVQREALTANSTEASFEWDNKWYSAVKQLPDRWIVEVAIPFKTLRYNEGVKSWRVNFNRMNRKANENGNWYPVPRNFDDNNLVFTGNMHFPEAPRKAGFNPAFIPYVAGSNYNDYSAGTPALGKLNTGFDAKIAVSSALYLDLTVNPDFSQVEVDRQQINLTRFNLFFPERRQFFIENSDLFAQFGFENTRAFFSRRIGLSTPILAGARLSGKIGQDWRLGLMTIQTEGNTTEQTPSQNFSVLALQKKIFAASNVGLFAMNKQDFVGSTVQGAGFNRVLGLNANLQTKDGRYWARGFYLQSFSPSDNAGALSHGFAFNYNAQEWGYGGGQEYVGRNYNNSVGFTPRQENYDPVTEQTIQMQYRRIWAFARHSIYPKSKLINYIEPGTYHNVHLDSLDGYQERYSEAWVDVQFQNRAFFAIFATNQHAKLLWPLQIRTDNGEPLIAAGSYTYNGIGAFFRNDARKLFTYTLRLFTGQFYHGTTHQYDFTLGYRFQPYGSITVGARHNDIQLPDTLGRGRLTLGTVESQITFTRNLFLTTISQYNTQNRNLSVYARLQWRFAPMSDFFVVYGDNYTDRFGIKNRSIVFKLVYWIST